MSLRKSPARTPARIEASRRNARKSTGPRTARGKAQSRMNSLRTGGRSAFYKDFYLTMFNAPPCQVDQTARAILTPELAAQPLFARAVELFRDTEIALVEEQRWKAARYESRKVREGSEGEAASGSAVSRSALGLADELFRKITSEA
jgi:hypothetical protein